MASRRMTGVDAVAGRNAAVPPPWYWGKSSRNRLLDKKTETCPAVPPRGVTFRRPEPHDWQWLLTSVQSQSPCRRKSENAPKSFVVRYVFEFLTHQPPKFQRCSLGHDIESFSQVIGGHAGQVQGGTDAKASKLGACREPTPQTSPTSTESSARARSGSVSGNWNTLWVVGSFGNSVGQLGQRLGRCDTN